MSLNWDVTACADHEELLEDAEWPVTNAIIWATMSVDMGTITEENVDEFAARVTAVNTIHGDVIGVFGPDGFVPITLEQLRRRIGLKTNVTTKTAHQWRARVATMVIDLSRKEVARQHKLLDAQ